MKREEGGIWTDKGTWTVMKNLTLYSNRQQKSVFFFGTLIQICLRGRSTSVACVDICHSSIWYPDVVIKYKRKWYFLDCFQWQSFYIMGKKWNDDKKHVFQLHGPVLTITCQLHFWHLSIVASITFFNTLSCSSSSVFGADGQTSWSWAESWAPLHARNAPQVLSFW